MKKTPLQHEFYQIKWIVGSFECHTSFSLATSPRLRKWFFRLTKKLCFCSGFCAESDTIRRDWSFLNSCSFSVVMILTQNEQHICLLHIGKDWWQILCTYKNIDFFILWTYVEMCPNRNMQSSWKLIQIVKECYKFV